MELATDKQIDSFVRQNIDELIQHRRWFHQHPELSFKEEKTAQYVKQYLERLGIINVRTVAKTGVVCDIGDHGLIHGARFNMDGLPILENTDLSCKSLHYGYSHSCGHDFELAWGLLIAKYFQQHKPNGVLRLIFQPAEEGPGEEDHGKTGGQILAEAGVFDIRSVMSLHVEPEIDLGTVSIIEGEVTCSAYDFEFRLVGKTCHAAKPHQGKNPIPFASQLVNEIYQLQQNIDTAIYSEEGYLVLTVSSLNTHIGKENVESVDTSNTIPEYAVVKGISRVRSKRVKHLLIEGLMKISSKYNDLMDDNNDGKCGCTLILNQTGVATVNDEACVRNVIDTARSKNIKIIGKRTSWRDDAGWASEKTSSAHGFVGIYNGVETYLHTPEFNPSEAGLKVGLEIFIGTLEKNFINITK